MRVGVREVQRHMHDMLQSKHKHVFSELYSGRQSIASMRFRRWLSKVGNSRAGWRLMRLKFAARNGFVVTIPAVPLLSRLSCGIPHGTAR